MSTNTLTHAAAADIADTIRRQIGLANLMTLGAHNLRAGSDTAGNAYLAFHALILPFTKSGKRGTRARRMLVTVTYTAADLYDVTVIWAPSDLPVWNTHYTVDGLDAAQLRRVMLALDYDGPTVLNPRYV